MIRLSHVAIACPDVKSILTKLSALKMSVEKEHEVPTEKVRASMVPIEISKHFRIELLQPTSGDSPISKFLEKNQRGGIHHLSFEVKNIEAWKRTLEQAGFEIVPPGIRKAARGQALFIHPKSFSGVLVELEEIL